MELIAPRYGLPADALPSIYRQEGGTIGKVQVHPNGAEDVGPLQINVQWLPTLRRYWGLTTDALVALRDKPCWNVDAAAAILSSCRTAKGGNIAAAIGCYHSPTPTRAADYTNKVMTHALRDRCDIKSDIACQMAKARIDAAFPKLAEKR
jgi:hypothetical protein